MERCNKILNNAYYRRCIDETNACEENRVYCLHDMTHALDVARIAYIRALENGDAIAKDVIYAAALVHDAGRCVQYTEGVPHNEASAEIARRILPECGYSDDETAEITTAVAEHREGKKSSRLSEILKLADDLSRMCLWCKARKSCKWDDEEMNMTLEY